VRTLLLVSITQFNGVILTLFSTLACEPTTGRVYLIPALPCAAAGGLTPFQALMVVLLVLVCLLPLAMGGWLLYMRRQPVLEPDGERYVTSPCVERDRAARSAGERDPKPENGRLGERKVAARFAVLYHEYRPTLCWWEAWMLLRRVLLLAVFVPLVSRYGVAAAKLALSLAVGMLLVVQFVARPFEATINNYLETFGLSLLLLLVAANSQNVPAAVSGGVSVGLLLVGVVVLLAPLVYRIGVRVVGVMRERLRPGQVATLPQRLSGRQVTELERGLLPADGGSTVL
jgi:hypothetical protein